MQIRHANVAHVLKHFGLDENANVVDLANAGGFSGANLWRINTGSRQLCLRRWPEEFRDQGRLHSIHAVLRHAAKQLNFLPVPLFTTSGATFVTSDNYFWELTPWLPGQANFRQEPSQAKLRAALQAIAQWHLAVADFVGTPVTATSPGLKHRLEQIVRWQSDEIVILQQAVAKHDWPELRERGQRVLAQFALTAPAVKHQLEIAARQPVPLVPCLRDVWHDHLLFTGDEVTGLVDFGALRHESPAGDIARLLGSLVGNDRIAWQTGLGAYAEIRPLEPAESALVEVFDASGLLLSGISWLQWIALEGRVFAHRTRVIERLDEVLARMENDPPPVRLILPGEP